MKIDKKSLKRIQSLVGNVTQENLKYVDCYISQNLSMFIPSVGFCEYAITPNHTHPAYSFVLFFSKEKSIVPLEIQVLPNHYLVAAMSPKISHEEKETDNFTRYIAIFISSEFYEKYYSIYSDKSPERYFWKQFLIKQDFMVYIKKFMSEYENKQPGYESILESLSTIITNELIRSILEVPASSDLFIEKLETEKAIEYMHQNFGCKLKVEYLARLVNMSESHFIRTFKKETQLSPIEYLIRLRLDKAKKLIRAKSNTITEIALQCGFNSSPHFSSCFLKQYGITPTEYQNLYSK
ncbi:AraC family transcriptional regulator [Clostridium carboxidivorans P7]|uniref:Transcriptional regulator, AraC family n=1 Tax=Clostridium carboxidivorans P7 TaxID=536227 RepID=C6Q2J7_9CLOT|nr:AraC family transcriptional regulator [Clostridium carboxidivorans]AKN30309.1 AraC family transcriptional regulator [Clostridium carboxidivorans P7]EET84288.1 transcriptional regulator, AraC family [Clostridium carboxidivorans P7]